MGSSEECMCCGQQHLLLPILPGHDLSTVTRCACEREKGGVIITFANQLRPEQPQPLGREGRCWINIRFQDPSGEETLWGEEAATTSTRTATTPVTSIPSHQTESLRARHRSLVLLLHAIATEPLEGVYPYPPSRTPFQLRLLRHGKPHVTLLHRLRAPAPHTNDAVHLPPNVNYLLPQRLS